MGESDLKIFEGRSNTENLAVMLTHRCSMNCRYCFLDREKPDTKEEVVYRAIDLLCTSAAPEVELQFFGGEPLLRFDLVKKAIRYAQKIAGQKGKRIKYLLTTNGLLLDEDKVDYLIGYNVTVMLSMDGMPETHNKNRPLINNNSSFNAIIKNLNLLADKKASFFVNLVYCPEDIDCLADNITFLNEQGAKDVQIAYAIGADFKPINFPGLLGRLDDLIGLCRARGINLLNLDNDSEPILASGQITVDSCGRIYTGCAIVLEKCFPDFNELFYAGTLKEMDSMRSLRRDKRGQLNMLMERKKDIPGRILNNLYLGVALGAFFKSYSVWRGSFLRPTTPGEATGNYLYGNKMMVMLTHRCSMNCRYCFLDREKPDTKEEVVYRAIDLLCTSAAPEVELQFFGGEPLLRFDLVKKAIRYAQKIAGQKGKRIKYLLTTNGLLLDEDKVDYLDSFGVQYILSIDGNLSTQLLNRPALKGEKYPFGRLVKNMRALQAKKADFFVNLVIGPSNLGELEDNVEFFLEHGVKNFRFSYELGIHWSPVHTGIYFYRLFRVITQGLDDKDVEVINIGADDEPFLASPALTVDYDGKVYCGCTITLEKLFLNLRKINLVGRIGTDDSMERIRKTRSGAINDLLTFYPEGSRLNKLVLNNLGLGFISDGFFNGLFKKKSKEQIALLSEGKTVNSLMVMCTYACQLACDYCEVKRSGASMSPASLYRAIDLLLTTRSNECQLRFWGGEPLLKWGLIKKGVFYAEKKAAQRNKSVKFMITTNGLLLDSRKISFLRKHPVEVMFSLDGAPETNDMHRFSRGKTKLGMRPLEKLKLLIGSGVPYFINIVATARTAGDLAGNLSYLNGLGVERAQLCYRCGEIWPRARMEKLIAQIKIFLEKSSGREFLMNFKNNCEPTMLSQEVIVDTDEKVYFDAAIFMENKFPGLRGNYYLGDASDIKCIDTLYAAKRWLHEKFQGACSNKEERAALENNIGLGLRVEDAFSGFSKTSLDSNENPRLIPIVKGDFFAQRPILGALGIDSLFLYIDGPCFNNCLFCRHKQEDFSDIFKIEARLRSNLKIGAVKLSVIGNEPLLHPEIGQILRLAKKYGFRNIEMMTSGELLGRRDFFREIIEAGASSFSLPIFSREEKTHDAIVGRKGSLGMILAGIKNAMDYSTKVFVHTNLIRQNLDHLPGLERFVKEGLSLPFVILPVRPKTANLAYEKLVPSYGAIIKKLRHTESLVGFPLCVVNKVQKNLFKDKDELSQSIKLYLLDQNFIKLRSCAECSYKNKCLGVFKDHFYLYPKDRLEPFLKNDKLKSRPV